jgi:hypothetical protein
VHRALAWMLVGVALVVGYIYYQNHSSQLKTQTGSPLQRETKPQSQDQTSVNKIISPIETLIDQAEGTNAGPAQEDSRRPWKAHPNDHIGDSPVGTSAVVVHKTFAVSSAAKFLFEVPPHAANPQFHGTYHSFAKTSGVQSADEAGDVDLLLMNDQQYADYLHGNVADVVYSVDSSHDQDVSLGLPATRDQPAQYYLVFRNSASNAGKKVVQADFQLDF